MAKPIKNKLKKRNTGTGFSFKLSSFLTRAVTFSIPYVLSLTLVGILVGSAAAFTLNSPTFVLTDVRVMNVGTLTPAQAFQFCELQKGENLIALDLVNVQQVIKRRHPEFKEVQVRRILPNRIEVVLKRRTPTAQIAFSRFLQIDREFVILPGSSVTPFKNLTIIEGSPLPREGVRIGAKVSDSQTVKALKLSEIIKRSKILKDHQLTKVDMGDPNNFSLIVDGEIDIKIGRNHFIERLKILDQTLKTVELDRSKIRYIDLRFDDVVIGPR